MIVAKLSTNTRVVIVEQSVAEILNLEEDRRLDAFVERRNCLSPVEHASGLGDINREDAAIPVQWMGGGGLAVFSTALYPCTAPSVARPRANEDNKSVRRDDEQSFVLDYCCRVDGDGNVGFQPSIKGRTKGTVFVVNKGRLVEGEASISTPQTLRASIWRRPYI